jgi:hypothetical protein
LPPGPRSSRTPDLLTKDMTIKQFLRQFAPFEKAGDGIPGNNS